MRRVFLMGFALVAVSATGAAARGQAPGGAENACFTAPVPPISQPARALRFGITPQIAGSAGAAQLESRPVDDAATLAALRRLRPPGRDLVMRLNRMFWSDGAAGLARYAKLVDGYAAQGFRNELQVRYHPPEGSEGDIDAWVRYVREAVRTFAPRRSVVELSITNEANLPVSPNTSDGVYEGVLDAIVQGVIAAREEADRLGRPDLKLGFTYAYRFTPQADNRFFSDLGARARARPAFFTALDHVGIQLYPGLFFPPATTDADGDVIEGINLLRSCFMPKAGLGRDTAIWVSENGYATRGGMGEARQATDLAETIEAVSRYAGTLNVTDFRYFNLRDNVSTGPDLFDAVGLLFDDYREKRAFGVLRGAIERFGRPEEALTVAPAGSPTARRLRLRVSPGSVRRGRRVTLRATVTAGGRPVAGVRVRIGGVSARSDRRGRAVLRVRLVGRPGARTARATLRGARSGRATLRVVR